MNTPKNEEHSPRDLSQPVLQPNLFICNSARVCWCFSACVSAGSRSVGSQLQSRSSDADWKWVLSAQDNYGIITTAKPEAKYEHCHLSTNHCFLIKLACVCVLVLVCVRTHEPWHVGRWDGMSFGMRVCAHVCGGQRMSQAPSPMLRLCIFV